VKTINEGYASKDAATVNTGSMLVAVKLRIKFSMWCSGYAPGGGRHCGKATYAVPGLNMFVNGMPTTGRSIEDLVHY